MCTAAKNAKGTNPSSRKHKYYRLFVFLIATTLFHELGYIFIIFLSLGDVDTPPEYVPDLPGIQASKEPQGQLQEGIRVAAGGREPAIGEPSETVEREKMIERAEEEVNGTFSEADSC